MPESKAHSLTTRHIWMRAVTALLIVIVALWGLFNLDHGNAYLWIKAVHVIAVICWMAGMLYLPRLFIYHCAAKEDFSQSETFKLMERRLLRYIINPAMIVAWITGLWIAWEIYGFRGGWLHLKFAAVILLSAFHGFLVRATRHFAEDRNHLSGKTWRILNEVPTVLMIVAVIAVIVKIPD